MKGFYSDNGDRVDKQYVDNQDNSLRGEIEDKASLSGINSVDALKTTNVNIVKGSVYVLDFYAASKGGGGVFYWDANRSQADHDGGVVIDPAHTATAGDETGGWYASQNVGTGVWVRNIDSHVTPEMYGYSSSSAGDAIQSAINYVQNNQGIALEGARGTYSVSKKLTVASPCKIDMGTSVLYQKNGSNLPTVVELNIEVSSRPVDVHLAVNANKNNNTTSRAILLSNCRSSKGRFILGAEQADVGVEVNGNVEYANIECHTIYCEVGIYIFGETSATADENYFKILAEFCDTGLKIGGGFKTSGGIDIYVEQCNEWGIDMSGPSYYTINGELRRVGKTNGFGGVKITQGRIEGSVIMVGDDLVSNIGLYTDGTACVNLDLDISDFTNPLKLDGLNPNLEYGSFIRYKRISCNGPSIIGNAAKTTIENLELRGSRTTLILENVKNSEFHCRSMALLSLLAGATNNIISIPVRDRRFTLSNDLGTDNTLIFKGVLPQANLGNSTVIANTMVERVTEWGGPAYFNSNYGRWVNANGVLFRRTLTIDTTSQAEFLAHNLGLTGNGDVKVIVTPITDLSAAGISNWWTESTNNVLYVRVNAFPSIDIQFHVTLLVAKDAVVSSY